jgi:hypothetical protein
MPTVTQAPQPVYVHCTTPTCPGMFQEKVDGFRRETSFSFYELGGDIPGTERSTVEAVVADEDVATCEHCGAHRDAALEPRPQYEKLSGFDPAGLLNMGKYDPSRVNPPAAQRDAEVEALKARLEAQEEKFNRLMTKLGEQDTDG